MDLKALSNSELLGQIKSLVQEERNLTSKVLKYLREIEIRRLYLERGYSSLFAFCTDCLCYDESQAQRRISAMRLLRDVPEIEIKINTGELTLTALTQAQSFFNQRAKDEKPLGIDEKIEVLKTLEGKSKRQCEKELIRVNPSPLPKKLESQRLITEELTELKVVLERKTMEKLERIKELLSHQDSKMKTADLIDKLADQMLSKIDPEKKKGKNTNSANNPKSPAPAQVKRYIPVQVKKAVWQRDEGKCSYIDSVTKKRCGSRFKVQFDHIHPHSMGGLNSRDNLRLYCQAHNLLHATQIFGQQKMHQFIPRLEM